MMTKAQKRLYEQAVEFERLYPERGFHVTQREWYNEQFEIRAAGSVAKALVKQGKLRVSVNAPNGIGAEKSVYHAVKE